MGLLIDNYLKKKDKNNIDLGQPRELLIDRYSSRKETPFEIKPEKESLSLFDRIKRAGVGAGKFIARTGIEAVNLLTGTLDFAADFLSGQIEEKIRKPSKIGISLTGKETERSKKVADRWKSFYDTTGGEVTEKMKSFTQNLREIDFIKPSEEWTKASTKDKFTKKLPETILNIGPGVVSSLGMFAINPALGFAASAGSVADDVKTIAEENGVNEDRAELLGLGTGLLVGWLDKIVPDEVFSPQQKKLFVSGLAKRILKTGLKETGTEIVQEDIQLLAEATVREDITKDEVILRNLMSGLGGLLGGVGVQTTTTFVNGIRSGDIGGLDPRDEPFKPIVEKKAIIKPKEDIKKGGLYDLKGFSEATGLKGKQLTEAWQDFNKTLKTYKGPESEVFEYWMRNKGRIGDIGKETNKGFESIRKIGEAQTRIDKNWRIREAQRLSPNDRMRGIKIEKELLDKALVSRQRGMDDLYNSLEPKHKIGDIVEVESKGLLKKQMVKIEGADFNIQQSMDQINKTGFPSSFRFEGLNARNIKTGEGLEIYSDYIVNGETLSSTIKKDSEKILSEFLARKKDLPSIAQPPISDIKPIKVEPKKPITPKKPILEETSEKRIRNTKNIEDTKSTLRNIQEELNEAVIEAEASAIIAQEKRAGVNVENINKLKRIYALNKKFQEGDIETIRASKTGDLLNRVVENVQETHPEMSEQEAFDFALELPTKAEELARTPTTRELGEKEKKLSKFLDLLKAKQSELKIQEDEELSKEWRQALATQEKLISIVKVPGRQLPVGEGVEKISRLQSRLKGTLETATTEDAEELGLTKFRQMNQEDQIADAVEYVTNNTEEALKVVRGEIDPPSGLLQNSIFAALVELGQLDTDVATKIASLTSTRFGQEINILQKIMADNPVVKMQNLVATRVETYEKKRGVKIEEKIKTENKKIDNDFKAPNKSDWDSFLEGIKC